MGECVLPGRGVEPQCVSGPGTGLGYALWKCDSLLRGIFDELVVGSLCYRGAVSAAIKWGETVKGAFDVYLPKLAQALGFALPDSPDLQRKFWSEWSTQFRFQTAADLADFTRLKVEGSEEKSRGAGDTPPKEDDENC